MECVSRESWMSPILQASLFPIYNVVISQPHPPAFSLRTLLGFTHTAFGCISFPSSWSFPSFHALAKHCAGSGAGCPLWVWALKHTGGLLRGNAAAAASLQGFSKPALVFLAVAQFLPPHSQASPQSHSHPLISGREGDACLSQETRSWFL